MDPLARYIEVIADLDARTAKALIRIVRLGLPATYAPFSKSGSLLGSLS